jgi:hypothetical protein
VQQQEQQQQRQQNTRSKQVQGFGQTQFVMMLQQLGSLQLAIAAAW